RFAAGLSLVKRQLGQARPAFSDLLHLPSSPTDTRLGYVHPSRQGRRRTNMPHEKRRTVENRRHQPWSENPSEEWAYGLEHMKSGEWEEAINHCQQAIEIWPTYFDAWLLIGGALEETGEYTEALAAVERASEIAIMELSQSWNNLASLYLIRREWEQALTVDRILDLIDPLRHPIICYRMAIAYTQLGDLTMGFKWLLEAIEARPDFEQRALGETWLAPLHERVRHLSER
ncbi:tetratricopeptide repeat protein, partial [Chloroflexota bacterium]